jgi:hypothetical protein
MTLPTEAQLKTLEREELIALPEGLEAERVFGLHLEATVVYLSPTSTAARGSSGWAARASAEISTCRWRVRAPTRSVPFSRFMNDSSAEPVHVDQRADVGHAQVEQRHEVLPPGREVWPPPPLGEKGKHLPDRPRAGVSKFGRFHTLAPVLRGRLRFVSDCRASVVTPPEAVKLPSVRGRVEVDKRAW